jgi:ATP-dependent Lon protease
MTGEVALSGVVGGVAGLEGKLRFAHSSPHIKVVVLPRDNLAEAEELVHKYGLSIRLLPVSHMNEVIRLLFLSSVGGASLKRPCDQCQPGHGLWQSLVSRYSNELGTVISTHS